jgi:uncharacterized protein YndB with AHSA1/START domain
METLANVVDDNEITLILKHQFDASVERVFDAWASSEALAEWMGPVGMSARDSTTDFKIGGNFCIPMVGDDTGNTHTAVGEYLEINRPRRMVFTWSWLQDDGRPGQLMTVALDFIDLNGRTEMTLSHSNFIDVEARDHHVSGWTGCFTSLGDYLSS